MENKQSYFSDDSSAAENLLDVESRKIRVMTSMTKYRLPMDKKKLYELISVNNFAIPAEQTGFGLIS